MYLGDGYISRTPRTYRLEVSLHRRQERVAKRVARAIAVLRPGRPAGFRHRRSVTIVNAYANAWPILFPQHEVGRKHQRPILLKPWQRRIVEQHPTEFLGGCIEADGCRHRASWQDATIRRIRSRVILRTSWSYSSGHAGWPGYPRDARSG